MVSHFKGIYFGSLGLLFSQGPKGTEQKLQSFTIYKAIELSSLRSHSIEPRNIDSIACLSPFRVWSTL